MPTEISPKPSKPKQVATRWLVRETLGNLILIALLFGFAGRWDWWNGWALSAVYILWTLGTMIFILPVNPEMLAERSRPKEMKTWDKILLTLMGLFMLALYAIAALDFRLGWSAGVPLGVQIAGVLIAMLGYDVLLVWSMVVNAYFVATVRIQSDRDQQVISSGPYRFVRHPGYLGTIMMNLAAPFLLNSVLALIPAMGVVVVLVVRTYLEDETLQVNCLVTRRTRRACATACCLASGRLFYENRIAFYHQN
jgi:protein-S-isoprenylcysteine O-methyltransferase Ste14